MKLFKESCCCLSVQEQDDGYDEFNGDYKVGIIHVK